MIHGDALPRNVRVTERGPMLLDLETFADDLREHDLTVLALARRRYGLDPDDYTAFTRSYGWDVTEWPGARDSGGRTGNRECGVGGPARTRKSNRQSRVRRQGAIPAGRQHDLRLARFLTYRVNPTVTLSVPTSRTHTRTPATSAAAPTTGGNATWNNTLSLRTPTVCTTTDGMIPT